MSLTIQQIILDAKRLANRLKEHDTTADALLSQAQNVYQKIDTMKQYQEKANELNESARQRPHAVLVAGIQQENRHLRELQQENRELRAALDEHQKALELIMSKYRQHVTRLVASSKIDLAALGTHKYSKVICEQSNKICEMAAVMRKSAEIDEQKALEERELVTRLATENKGLRELLEISCKNGTLRNSLLGIESEDKEMQTEMNCETS
ncbi:FGFR1 oncogene partner 2 homolog isoform X2 [Schistocerca americana]|uniref:FGFR1 oncogene partner 2 homolog isoform X2 n=1 Tax=Schistocerca americana TaxID=7009 RepID=UPI001F4F5FBD|nr:FGFR1 oncogene partner 2 homolog isoform X2 [Schistocerca americana]XP_047096732.1 FGFR1 oncogene partner 2 homolog isoform X2 [Schistocerca piceifrons]XP_049765635.1 FGFR1 oncogene partner 2 homolog isoform X2 [Schistocerca cancellata]XP_049938414.1 FGFR1 oncogene partner 2 homolog isoform X2 [Schistocerca serialis cubense]